MTPPRLMPMATVLTAMPRLFWNHRVKRIELGRTVFPAKEMPFTADTIKMHQMLGINARAIVARPVTNVQMDKMIRASYFL